MKTPPLLDVDEVAEIVNRLKIVTRGCEVRLVMLWVRRNMLILISENSLLSKWRTQHSCTKPFSLGHLDPLGIRVAKTSLPL